MSYRGLTEVCKLCLEELSSRCFTEVNTSKVCLEEVLLCLEEMSYRGFTEVCKLKYVNCVWKGFY